MTQEDGSLAAIIRIFQTIATNNLPLQTPPHSSLRFFEIKRAFRSVRQARQRHQGSGRENVTLELKALMSALVVPRKSLFESGFRLESSGRLEAEECQGISLSESAK